MLHIVAYLRRKQCDSPSTWVPVREHFMYEAQPFYSICHTLKLIMSSAGGLHFSGLHVSANDTRRISHLS